MPMLTCLLRVQAVWKLRCRTCTWKFCLDCVEQEKNSTQSKAGGGERGVDRLRRAIDGEGRAEQSLDGRRYRAIRIVIMGDVKRPRRVSIES
jgi:hypothetical protein